MTRRECEKKLMELAEQMREVYLTYNPVGDLLSLSVHGNGFININDAFFDSEHQLIMSATDKMFNTVEAVRYSNGKYRYGNVLEEGV